MICIRKITLLAILFFTSFINNTLSTINVPHEKPAVKSYQKQVEQYLIRAQEFVKKNKKAVIGTSLFLIAAILTPLYLCANDKKKDLSTQRAGQTLEQQAKKPVVGLAVAGGQAVKEVQRIDVPPYQDGREITDVDGEVTDVDQEEEPRIDSENDATTTRRNVVIPQEEPADNQLPHVIPEETTHSPLPETASPLSKSSDGDVPKSTGELGTNEEQGSPAEPVQTEKSEHTEEPEHPEKSDETSVTKTGEMDNGVREEGTTSDNIKEQARIKKQMLRQKTLEAEKERKKKEVEEAAKRREAEAKQVLIRKIIKEGLINEAHGFSAEEIATIEERAKSNPEIFYDAMEGKLQSLKKLHEENHALYSYFRSIGIDRNTEGNEYIGGYKAIVPLLTALKSEKSFSSSNKFSEEYSDLESQVKRWVLFGKAIEKLGKPKYREIRNLLKGALQPFVNCKVAKNTSFSKMDALNSIINDTVFENGTDLGALLAKFDEALPLIVEAAREAVNHIKVHKTKAYEKAAHVKSPLPPRNQTSPSKGKEFLKSKPKTVVVEHAETLKKITSPDSRLTEIEKLRKIQGIISDACKILTGVV